MNIVIAIDSFKGSLSSLDAGNAAREGILRAIPDASVDVRPMADGGEGTVEAVAAALGGELRTVTVSDPLGRKIPAVYCIAPDAGAGRIAVIEMAAAAGLPLLDASERNPLVTTTFGVGEMIADAIAAGCRDFVIGIGGSATNDGGTGMLAALGFGFLDKNGQPIAHGAKGLAELVSITDENALPALRECRFRVACDVTNPLCGELGCSRIFAPQKGADEAAIEKMDGWLKNFAALTKKKYPAADPAFPGCGAAGGMGFALREFLGGELVSGVSLVLGVTRLEDAVRSADIVITGEGRMDAQTAMGKAPAGVASLAKKHGKPCIAFAGAVKDDARACNQAGIDAFFPIRRSICTLEEAMEPSRAASDLADTAEQVFRLITTCGQISSCRQDR